MAGVCAFRRLSTLLFELVVLVSLMLLTQATATGARGTGPPLPVNRTCDLRPSPARNSLSHRVYGADMIVYGKVVELVPKDYRDDVYDARMDVYCILKGKALPRRLTVSYFGNVTACSSTKVEAQNTYILFLTSSDNIDYFPHEVNIQTAALPADNATMAAVVQVCGVRPELPRGVDKYTQEENCAGLSAWAPDQCVAPTKNSGKVHGIHHLMVILLVATAVHL